MGSKSMKYRREEMKHVENKHKIYKTICKYTLNGRYQKKTRPIK